MADKNAVVVITGGSGGMGQACARRLGKNHPLLLIDINAAGLEATANTLSNEGYRVSSFSGDLTDPRNLAQVIEATQAIGPLKALVHTAGLSPAMADAKRIMEVNWTLTHRLSEAFLAIAQPGSCAVLIASTTGYMVPPIPGIDELLADPTTSDFWSKIEPFAATSEASYSVSKLAVIRHCEHAVAKWGARGARIVSISPGIIATPMSKLEMERQPTMASMAAMTPIQRHGTADEIAAAVEFLCSDNAAFITGADLRIDGGAISAMLQR